ncbi:MAG TPA: four helix bundle protein [Victivallales bacterium]|nr:four helix bundle protein [Victivallales bacterium]
MKEVYELEVYQLAERLSDLIWYDFNNWDSKTKNSIGYQVIRSADSISANIAEGYGRFSSADKNSIYIQEVHLRKQNHGLENL